MKNMGSLAWKNNFFSPCFSKFYSYRNNLPDKVRQMFFSPPLPLFLWMEWLSQEHSWKTFGKKKTTHTVSGVGGVWGWGLQKFKLAPPVKITAAQKMVQCISPGLKRTFSGSQEPWENAAALCTARLRWPSQGLTLPRPTLRQISKGASLLKNMIKEYLPVCTCHLGMIYCQGVPFVTSYNMFS